MSCTTLEGIIKSCLNNLGGIYEILFTDQDNLTGKTVDQANWEVTAITHVDGFKLIEFKRYVGNYIEDEQNVDETGSTVVTTTLTLPLLRRDGAKSKALKIMGEGQRYLAVIVKDGNGKYWLFENMQLTTVGEGSGTAKADGSKYALTLVGMNDQLAYEVDPDIIADLVNLQS
jgi:hypothetical protein